MLARRFVHTARAVVFGAQGAPREMLSILRYDIQDPEKDEALVKLVGAPINPADVNQVEGVYPSPPRFRKDLTKSGEVAIGGNEGVFEVIDTGKDAKNLAKGDWVVPSVASFGTWTTFAKAPENELLKINKGPHLSPLEAASLGVNPGTAFRLLQDFVNLKGGDWFIQNGGTSSVGRMAVQLAKQWGVQSISVVRDRADIDDVTSELTKLGATKVVTEEQINDKSIRHIIKDWTRGQPIRLGLNCVGGRSATNVARQLGSGARLVTYGGMSKQPLSLPTSLLIFKQLEAHGFWLTRWNKENPKRRQAMLDELTEMFKSKQLVLSGINEVPWGVQETDEELLDTFFEALEAPGKHVLLAGAA